MCDGRREPFTFLGGHFGPMHYRKDGHWYLGAAPAKKAVQRVKGRIRQILRRAIQAPWEEVVAELNSVRCGAGPTTPHGTRSMPIGRWTTDVYERTRHFLRRRHKVPTRGTRRFSADRVFGSWVCSGSGAPPSWGHLRMPGCETRPRAGCGNRTSGSMRRGERRVWSVPASDRTRKGRKRWGRRKTCTRPRSPFTLPNRGSRTGLILSPDPVPVLRICARTPARRRDPQRAAHPRGPRHRNAPRRQRYPGYPPRAFMNYPG